MDNDTRTPLLAESGAPTSPTLPFKRRLAWSITLGLVGNGVLVLLWETWAKDKYLMWRDSCEVSSIDSNLHCDRSDRLGLTLPPFLATCCCLFVAFIVSMWIPSSLSVEMDRQGFFSCKGNAAASVSAILTGVSACVLALWLPPQHWHGEGVDGKSTTVSIIGAVLVISAGAIGFRSVSFTFMLLNLYSDTWLCGALAVLQLDDSGFQGYPRPRLWGTSLLWLFLAALVAWALTHASQHRSMLLASVGTLASVFFKVVVLCWEVAFQSNMARLVPLMTILGITASFLSLVNVLHSGQRENPLLSVSTVENKDDAPQDHAGFFSRYTFWWVFGTLRCANKTNRLDEEDLPKVPFNDRPSTLFRLFREEWRKTGGKGISGWSLLYMLSYKIQRGTFLSSFLHGWCFLLLMLLDPILLKRLLATNEDGSQSDDNIAQSLVLVVVLSISMFVRVTCMEICYFDSTRVNNNARSVLVSAIFRKTLRGQDSLRYNTGTLTNLMATDADKLGKTSWMVFFISQWTWALGTLPVVIYFMHQTIGNAVWIGMCTILFGGLAARRLGNLEKPAVRRLQELRDERSQLMKEILSSINVIKLQAWEEEWRDRVYKARNAEMKQLVIMRLLQAANLLVATLLNVAIPVSIFAWYTAVEGNKLDSKTAFTTLAWISQMQWSINVLPAIYNMYASLAPSCERLVAFLSDGPADFWLEKDIVDESAAFEHLEEEVVASVPPVSGPVVILKENATLGYLRRQEPPEGNHQDENNTNNKPTSTRDSGQIHAILADVNLEINRGELVIIAGPVGSGKSTLLAVLSKGLEPLTGSCTVLGRRAYVGQRPFLLNETVQNNITFGLPFDEQRYKMAVEGAALEQDLDALAEGDATIVGENGVQLSGGQRARIALARALYSDADVFFMDDVLSAVDATTGQYIWSKTLTGSLRGRTIILVTHQLQYLSRPEVDKVAILGKGKISHLGPWREIQATVNKEIASFVDQESKKDSPDSEGNDKAQQQENAQVASSLLEPREPPTVTLLECETRLRGILDSYVGRMLDGKLIDDVCTVLRGETQDKETRQEGLISWEDFKVYLRVFGSNTTVALLMAALVTKAVLDIFMNVWLSIWGDAASSSMSYLYWYVGIGVASSVFASIQSVVLTVCALVASRKIHEQLFECLLGAAMSFFDRTPSGQIMNRFLQDLANIDNFVPNAVMDQITKTLNMLTQIGLVLLFAPWVIATLPFIFIPYFVIFGTVRCAARDTRRLEAIAHSPVYTQFSDILRGKLTIRAFAVERKFEHWNGLLVRFMAQGKYANEAVCKWAQTLTTQNGCLLYLSCGIVCVYLVHNGTMTLGQFGLVLLYSANLQRASMDYMMGLTTLESQFVSVERVAEFTRTPNEFVQANVVAHMKAGELRRHSTLLPLPLTATNGEVQPADPVLQDNEPWPSKGLVEFKNVKLRYALHRQLVLNGLSFRVEPGSKVALCGRTGSGKSSAFGALGRLYPIASGRIEIDGVDIETLPLQTVRRALHVITQDSILVCGTMRSNLTCVDSSVTEEDMWNVLEQVQMKEFVAAQPGQLDFEIEDGGKNLSVGQRQLLCTARALLPRNGRKPRVLLCDEATANIDLATDEKIHDVLLNLDATVVMIAHRLQHIRRFDSVVVLSPGGVLAEQGSPAELLSRPTSALNQLFKKAGLS